MKKFDILESKLNIHLPEVYKEFITRCPNTTDIRVKLVDVDTAVSDFLSIDIEIENNIYEVYLEYRDLMLDGIIPIAKAEYDDLICLYYIRDRDGEPSVIYWSYELSLEDRQEGVLDVASSFSEFLVRYVNKV